MVATDLTTTQLRNSCCNTRTPQPAACCRAASQLQDLDGAIDSIFNRQIFPRSFRGLIQSRDQQSEPAYIERVTEIFKNNGAAYAATKAVITAIIDPELAAAAIPPPQMLPTATFGAYHYVRFLRAGANSDGAIFQVRVLAWARTRSFGQRVQFLFAEFRNPWNQSLRPRISDSHGHHTQSREFREHSCSARLVPPVNFSNYASRA